MNNPMEDLINTLSGRDEKAADFDNPTGDNPLMVSISLAEYRELVLIAGMFHSSEDCDCDDGIDVEDIIDTNNHLKEENDCLRKHIEELKFSIDKVAKSGEQYTKDTLEDYKHEFTTSLYGIRCELKRLQKESHSSESRESLGYAISFCDKEREKLAVSNK